MKIVVAALVANIGVASFGIAVRINTGDGYSQTSHVLKVKSRHQDTKFAVAVLTP
jgi:hypothetical protein